MISRNPDTGVLDQGIYRFMYRSKTETNIDMRNDTHYARIHALRNQQLGKDMRIAVVIGGPTLDKIASMVSFRGTDDWDVLGGFYGEPGQDRALRDQRSHRPGQRRGRHRGPRHDQRGLGA